MCMYLIIVFLPLLGSVLSGFGGFLFGRMGAVFLSTTFVAISCLLSWIAFYDVGILGSVIYVDSFNWLNSGSLFFNWSFLFDSLTVMMLIVVTTVSFLVHFYSVDYMKTDPHVSRFFSYLSLFTFFMLILVSSNNLVQLFVGWEGVGVCSYLLINFWHTRIQANKAALKAMIVNRVGDFGVTLGMVVIYYTFKSVDFSIIFSLSPYMINYAFNIFGYMIPILPLITILLFVGVMGKSAQIGLHTWLPDAMEGPTPVSALIHAATMVTAGVFLLIRFSPCLEYSNETLILVAIIGAVTAFFAATTGVIQNDLKRVIAYSTCSQLGYMVFACGLSSYSVSAFHLMNHAFFKALLFLGAGSVIHALSDEQDMRKMGGLFDLLPYTYLMILIGSLALMGIPFLTGYYSKDIILEVAMGTFEIKGLFAYWLGVLSAMFTAFYSFRLIYLTFLSKPNGFKSVLIHIHDAPFYMGLSLLLLAIGSIFVGYLFKDMMIGLGTSYWNNALLILPNNNVMFESEFLPVYVKMIPFFFSVLGASICLLLYTRYQNILYLCTFNIVGKKVYLYLNKKWFFDTLYNEWIVKNTLWLGYNVFFKVIDRGYVELFGPFGIEKLLYTVSNKVRMIHTGFLYHSAMLLFLGFFSIVCIMFLLTNLTAKYLVFYMLFSMMFLLVC